MSLNPAMCRHALCLNYRSSVQQPGMTAPAGVTGLVTETSKGLWFHDIFEDSKGLILKRVGQEELHINLCYWSTICLRLFQSLCGGFDCGWLPYAHLATLSLFLLNTTAGENKMKKQGSFSYVFLIPLSHSCYTELFTLF